MRTRNGQQQQLAGIIVKPETRPLFSRWPYDLPDEEEGWRRAEAAGLFTLTQQEIDALNEHQQKQHERSQPDADSQEKE